MKQTNQSILPLHVSKSQWLWIFWQDGVSLRTTCRHKSHLFLLPLNWLQLAFFTCCCCCLLPACQHPSCLWQNVADRCCYQSAWLFAASCNCLPLSLAWLLTISHATLLLSAAGPPLYTALWPPAVILSILRCHHRFPSCCSQLRQAPAPDPPHAATINRLVGLFSLSLFFPYLRFNPRCTRSPILHINLLVSCLFSIYNIVLLFLKPFEFPKLNRGLTKLLFCFFFPFLLISLLNRFSWNGGGAVWRENLSHDLPSLS